MGNPNRFLEEVMGNRMPAGPVLDPFLRTCNTADV